MKLLQSGAYPALPQQLKGVGLKTGNIASADLQKMRSFQLGQGRLTGQTITQQDQLSLPCRQALNELPKPGGLRLPFTILLHAERILQYIREGQGCVIFSGFQRLL